MLRRTRAFSSFGIVIVVMVLAVVAAVVAPRFSEAGIRESRMDELCQTLQLLRSQIELYKVQHEGRPPMQAADGTIVFDSEFEQMTCCTDMDGQIKRRKPRTAREGAWQFGPYLERVPENPFNRRRTVVRVRHEDEIPVVGDAGWAYVPESGQIYANDSIQHAGL
jgi:general secretion pathway protein G